MPGWPGQCLGPAATPWRVEVVRRPAALVRWQASVQEAMKVKKAQAGTAAHRAWQADGEAATVAGWPGMSLRGSDM